MHTFWNPGRGLARLSGIETYFIELAGAGATREARELPARYEATYSPDRADELISRYNLSSSVNDRGGKAELRAPRKHLAAQCWVPARRTQSPTHRASFHFAYSGHVFEARRPL